ncbi:MAG: hypothetical protein J0L92_31080 [Deltaproteobacteria bacterium]|nr:hypothetical protein [Deltaproteobacteria bacterium]
MRFLMTFESNPSAPPPTPQKLQELGEFTQKMLASGKVVLTGGLVRPSHGIKVTSEGGKVSFTDGPFVESKELIDGFAVVEAPDLEGAKQLCREFMAVAGDGKGEILAMFSPGG